MLNPEYLDNVTDDILLLLDQLETDILVIVADRIKKMGKVTDLSTYQIEVMQSAGLLKKQIEKVLKRYDPAISREVTRIYYDALKESSIWDYQLFGRSKKLLSPSQKQKIESSVERFEKAKLINKTFAGRQEGLANLESAINRMTMTVADTTEKAFIKECNKAYMKVESGATSWSDAYISAIDNLADNGVKTVLYTGSGRTVQRSIESAVKMNILTGINQQASMQTLDNAESLGADLVEVDAHYGSRPEHEVWQGKIFCLNGERDYIDAEGVKRHADDFYKVCRLGEVDGICGINCKHSFYPYMEGSPTEYTAEMIKNINSKTVTLNGEQITQYDAEQKLRICEANIRKYKRQEQMQVTAGQPTEKSKEKIREWQNNARHICKETGIDRNYINERIGKVDKTKK